MKLPFRSRCLAAALPILVLAAAPASGQESAGPEAAQSAAAAPASVSDVRVINMIVVKVNGVPIFLSDLQAEFDTQLQAIRMQYPQSEIEAQLPELRRQTLAALIDDRMMMQRADELQIVADANTVDRAIERLRRDSNMATEEEFDAALAANGLNRETLREQMRRSVRQQMLVSTEVQRGIFVSESEVERYYREHPELFEAPEQVRIEQLVFVGGEDLREQAVAAAGELRGGAALADVAASYPAASAFPADETPIRVRDLVEALATAVPDIAVGATSDPIRSQYGWHVVRVIDRQEHVVQPLEQVRENIRQRLLTEKSNERMQEYLGELRDKTHLQILATEFADIEELWRPAEQAAQGSTPERD